MKKHTNELRKAYEIRNQKENDRMNAKYLEAFNESNVQLSKMFNGYSEEDFDEDINSIPEIDYLKKMLDCNSVYLPQFNLHLHLNKDVYRAFTSERSFSSWSWDDFRHDLEEMRVTWYNASEAADFTFVLANLIEETMEANEPRIVNTDQVSRMMEHVLYSKADALADVDNTIAVTLDMKKEIAGKKVLLENLQYQRMSFTDNIRRLDAWLIILSERAMRLDFMGDTSNYAKSVEQEFEYYLECKRNEQAELDVLLKIYQSVEEDIDEMEGHALQLSEGATLKTQQIELEYEEMLEALSMANEIQKAMDAGVPLW